MAVVDGVKSDTEVMIEMHGRFAPHQAVEIAKAIEKYNPAWIEEPCGPDDLEALEYVKTEHPYNCDWRKIVLCKTINQFSIKGAILSTCINRQCAEYLK